MNDEIRNAAIDMGLEWGENWQACIQSRILKRYPQLTQHEADVLEALSRKVQKFAFALYEDVYFQKQTREDAAAQLQTRFPFLDEHNVSHLFNQGMYYAWHG